MVTIISRKTQNKMRIGDKLECRAIIKSINTRADTITFEIHIGDKVKFDTTILIENSPFEFIKT